MLIYLTSQNKPSFSSHTCTAMSHESLEAFDNNDYETWCEKKWLTSRFWRSLRTLGPSGNTVSLVGIEPGIKFLFILIPSIPGSEDAKLLAKQLCSK